MGLFRPKGSLSPKLLREIEAIQKENLRNRTACLYCLHYSSFSSWCNFHHDKRAPGAVCQYFHGK